MKTRIITLIVFSLMSLPVLAQWQLTGNAIGSTNYFGTNNNFPIDFRTNNVQRIRINGVSTGHTIHGFTGQVTTGFVGLSADPTYWTASSSLKTPVSLLHLIGDVNGHVPFAYRPWMKNGISFTLGYDHAFIGPRLVNDQIDVMEFVLGWGDNPLSTSGPDVMSFRFLGGEGGGGSDLEASDLDGREIMRLTGNGHVGIGPNFSSTNLPKADLHINTSLQDPLNPGSADAKIQLTMKGSTGETALDGFHMSIDQMSGNESGTAFFRQYENRSIRILSSIDASGVTMGERMRISTVSDPTTGNPGSAFATNTTRIGISSLGSSPLTRIRSVLHLGTNLNTDNDGWRNWMNVGTLSTENGHHLYTGIGSLVGGYRSANIAWGASSYSVSNESVNLNNMPLRFVFTSDASGSEDINGLSGREVARINSNGRMGIGNAAPGNRLVIESKSIDPYYATDNTTGGIGSSGLQFIRLTSANSPMNNPGQGVLTVDEHGNVIYVQGGSGSCEWDESGNDLFMGTPGACHPGNTGIGSMPMANTKLYVVQATNDANPIGVDVVTTGNSVGLNPTNIGVRSTLNSPPNSLSYGFYSEVSAVDKVFGAEFHANVIPSGSSASGIGCSGVATSSGAQINNTGVAGYAASGQSNAGVSGTAIAGESSVGVSGTAYYANTNYGVIANASFGASNFGVFTAAPTNGSNDWALWANGKTHCTSGFWSTSDQSLKSNINTIENSLEILSSINPTSYNFRIEEYPQMNLPLGIHYGVMAQELEEILPDLVTQAERPAEYDSLGNMISQAVQFKAVNYMELIPILIAGFKEQQTQIQSLQEQINGCCAANGTGAPSPAGMQLNNAPEYQQSVKLTNVDKPMLGFASPNPNKGEVFVDYYIPEGTNGTSEMLFTDAQGRPVQTVRINSNGNGRLNIDTTSLAAGQYQYTLIVDGEIIATRKMIRE